MVEIEEIENIKKWLAARTAGEYICIFSALFLLIGLTGGYLLGQYQESAKITDQLERHAVAPDRIIRTQDYFTLDGAHLYYLVKTDLKIEDYRMNISNGGMK